MSENTQPQERDDLIERLEALSRRDHDDLSVADEAIIEIRWLKSEIAHLRAQPSPREVALPLEPTAEMLSAGGAVYDHPNVYMGGPSARGRRLAGRAYKAMIEAALHGREDQP